MGMEKWTLLFDLDGVIIDTESQYDVFWHDMGVRILQDDHLESRIKGNTLTHILENEFAAHKDAYPVILEGLETFQKQMSYDMIPGVMEFITSLDRNRVSTAVVTSSDETKMQALYASHEGFRERFDRILTAENFLHSKPHPYCYLYGMELFDSTPGNTIVFEDSFNGLRAAKDSGAYVVGLTTSNSKESIAPYCHHVLDDFQGVTLDDLINKVRR